MSQKSESKDTKSKKEADRKSASASVLMNEVEELIARQKCHDVLNRYCRALDRCDLELMKSVYWDDAVDEHGIFDGNAQKFAEFIIDEIQDLFEMSMHAICNVDIDVVGDVAYTESYLISYQRVLATKAKLTKAFGPAYLSTLGKEEIPGETHDYILGGRYVDRLERRDGEWRIARRTVVMDWNMNVPSSTIWEEGINKHLTIRGERGVSDPVYMRD